MFELMFGKTFDKNKDLTKLNLFPDELNIV